MATVRALIELALPALARSLRTGEFRYGEHFAVSGRPETRDVWLVRFEEAKLDAG
jgi:hypothetical protein